MGPHWRVYLHVVALLLPVLYLVLAGLSLGKTLREDRKNNPSTHLRKIVAAGAQGLAPEGETAFGGIRLSTAVALEASRRGRADRRTGVHMGVHTAPIFLLPFAPRRRCGAP